MVEQFLIDELSHSPTRNWSEIISRHKAVREYLSLHRATVRDVDRFAERLGLSRRMFYRLIKRYQRYLEGKEASGKIRGRGRRLASDQEAAIEEAIRLAGPGASTKEVVEAVRHIGADRAIPVPSEFAIISRLRRGADLCGLNEKLQHQSDWMVDACSTDIVVETPNGGAEVVWITGLIDLASGRIESHGICVGVPSQVDLERLIVDWIGPNGQIAVSRWRLVATAVVNSKMELAADLLASRSILAAPCPRGAIRSSEALRSLLGQRLGNIGLRSRRPTTQLRVEGVSNEVAVAVVDHLIRKSNENLSTPEVTGSYRTLYRAPVPTNLFSTPPITGSKIDFKLAQIRRSRFARVAPSEGST